MSNKALTEGTNSYARYRTPRCRRPRAVLTTARSSAGTPVRVDQVHRTSDWASLISAVWQTGNLITDLVSFTSAASELAIPSPVTREVNHLVRATFVRPSSIRLEFSDQLFILPIDRLEMPKDRIDWNTAVAARSGEKLTVKVIGGNKIPIDSATLRYLVDEKYAAKIDQSIRDSHLTPAEQAEVSRLSEMTRDPRWNDVGDEDDLFE